MASPVVETAARSGRGAVRPGPTQRGRHQASLAYRLALDAIQADPDHEAARRAFGYQKYQNQWHTPYEVRMLGNGMVWHEKFGWIEKANLPRYVSGQRLVGVTWIDADNDAKLHSEIRFGWEIETEHYHIRTNHSIEVAVALGVKLEDLHRVWRQVFAGYYCSAADVLLPSPTGRGAGGEGNSLPSPAGRGAGVRAIHSPRPLGEGQGVRACGWTSSTSATKSSTFGP